jgi:hypothetical protein
MPLYLRRHADHYPDSQAAKFPEPDSYVVLSGSYLVGGIIGLGTKHGQEGRLDWGGGFADVTSSGAVATVEQAKEQIAKTFRAGIARAGLAELPDAKAGPPVREVRLTPVQIANWPKEGASFRDIDHPIVIYQPRSATVYSGELLIAVLNEQSRAPTAGHWSWALSGTRVNPPVFVWKGQERTLEAALAAVGACWLEWITWAGLQQKEPTRWKSS